MDAEERGKRVLECLRGLDVGESISADGIADEIAEKLSDVYDALENLEKATLVQMHVAATKGRDPTYTLTPKGKRALQPDVQEPPSPEPERVEAPADFPLANDRTCKHCGKELKTPGKRAQHEGVCGKNPKRKCPVNAKHVEHEPEPVPAPTEYAEAESNATATIEHEIPEVLEQLNAEDPDLCAGCGNYVDGQCDEGCDTDGDCNHSHRPAELQLQDVPTVEEILGHQQAAEDPGVPDEIPASDDTLSIKVEAIAITSSPGMNAVLRLISYCQKAVDERADLSLDAHVKVAAGFYVTISLDIPSKEAP